MMGERIRIRGVVQGVGFRPTVARVAQRLGLGGFVRNDGDGVLIAVAGTDDQRDAFMTSLMRELPPLARVDSVDRTPDPNLAVPGDFRIESSELGALCTEVAADAAVCADCAAEVFDPYARRFRYPLLTCTNCGPRYSIAMGLPFDRGRTTMVDFPLCVECTEEFEDVADRRFHAQAMACYRCGPQVRLDRADGRAFSIERYSMLDAVDAVASLLMMGEIVAIKGLGSYHLCCDATQSTAVQRLRERKRRPAKPLALMARDRAMVELYADFEPGSLEVFEGPAAPIVLLPAKTESPPSDARALAPEVAPGQPTLGFMRPYTPLHLLMLKRVDRPIVCTSGNLSDEPPCIDDQDAKEKLSRVADWFLIHQRPIRHRVDDSVVRVAGGRVRAIRRARGLAPGSLAMPPGLGAAPAIVACGGQFKATFALASQGRIIVSPHMGDLDHMAAFEAYVNSFELLTELYEHAPIAVAVDAHPEYRSTRWGRAMAEQRAWAVVEVQHHHAHVAAVMAEHEYPVDGPPVLGIAADGLGYGADGTIWGGEFLLSTYASFERVATFKPVPMLGGALASLQPWRNLLAHLRAEMSWSELELSFGDLPVIARLKERTTALLEQARGDPALSPVASSVGRLFDAVSAAVGVCFDQQAYESQAPIELEAAIRPEDLSAAMAEERYPIAVPKHPTLGIPYLEFKGLWSAILGDVYANTPVGRVSARFHVALAEAIVRVAESIRHHETGLTTAALGGGCFQNQTLLELTMTGLEKAGFHVLTPARFPANDGGISLGQAAVAAARLMR